MRPTPQKKSLSKRERREEYQGFVKLIQYNYIPLLGGPVTEVVLEIVPETVVSIQIKHEGTSEVNRKTAME
ncbi:hypothetical protein PHISCL_06011 [Aspergillus sclerotialis]|uniref:Uncharacterized protein n=1 Tax=Aspergillus sclerotialis TaxID=2070753 RepID=A0A3A2ZXA5_9EURO|nr:hypothetical protein PHISCL_06011 [Aspergillus sclerotialis]